MGDSIWNSTGLNTLVLAIGVAIAAVSIVSAYLIAKRRETAQALFASRSDDRLQEGMKCIVQLYADSGQNLTAYAGRKDTPECKHILYVLNHWEYVSISIQRGTFDDGMYKEASYATVTALHQKTRNFIDELRKLEHRPTIFQEFEKLAMRWKKKPLKCTLKET